MVPTSVLRKRCKPLSLDRYIASPYLQQMMVRLQAWTRLPLTHKTALYRKISITALRTALFQRHTKRSPPRWRPECRGKTEKRPEASWVASHANIHISNKKNPPDELAYFKIDLGWNREYSHKILEDPISSLSL